MQNLQRPQNATRFYFTIKPCISRFHKGWKEAEVLLKNFSISSNYNFIYFSKVCNLGNKDVFQFCLSNFTVHTVLSQIGKSYVSEEKIHLKGHSSIASWGSHHFIFLCIFQLTAQMLSCSIITPGNHRPNEGSSTDHLPGSNHQLSLEPPVQA